MTYVPLKTKEHFSQTKAIFEHMSSSSDFDENTKMEMLRAASEVADILNGKVTDERLDYEDKDDCLYADEDNSFSTDDLRAVSIKSYDFDYDDDSFPDYGVASYARVKHLSAQSSIF